MILYPISLASEISSRGMCPLQPSSSPLPEAYCEIGQAGATWIAGGDGRRHPSAMPTLALRGLAFRNSVRPV